MRQADSLYSELDGLSPSAHEVRERFLASVRASAGQAKQSYQSSLDGAQALVEQSLTLQASLLRGWRDAIEPEADGADWLGFMEQAVARRRELWQSWFAACRQTDFSAFERLAEQAWDQQALWLTSLQPTAKMNTEIEPAEQEHTPEPVRQARAADG